MTTTYKNNSDYRLDEHDHRYHRTIAEAIAGHARQDGKPIVVPITSEMRGKLPGTFLNPGQRATLIGMADGGHRYALAQTLSHPFNADNPDLGGAMLQMITGDDGEPHFVKDATNWVSSHARVMRQLKVHAPGEPIVNRSEYRSLELRHSPELGALAWHAERPDGSTLTLHAGHALIDEGAEDGGTESRTLLHHTQAMRARVRELDARGKKRGERYGIVQLRTPEQNGAGLYVHMETDPDGTPVLPLDPGYFDLSPAHYGELMGGREPIRSGEGIIKDAMLAIGGYQKPPPEPLDFDALDADPWSNPFASSKARGLTKDDLQAQLDAVTRASEVLAADGHDVSTFVPADRAEPKAPKTHYDDSNDALHRDWQQAGGDVEAYRTLLERRVTEGAGRFQARHGRAWTPKQTTLYPEAYAGIEDPVEMWHGCAPEAADGIQQTGFYVAPADEAKHGRALGDGVYLSHHFEKSAQYPFHTPTGTVMRIAMPGAKLRHMRTAQDYRALHDEIEGHMMADVQGHADSGYGLYRQLAPYLEALNDYATGLEAGAQGDLGRARKIVPPEGPARDYVLSKGIAGMSYPSWVEGTRMPSSASVQRDAVRLTHALNGHHRVLGADHGRVALETTSFIGHEAVWFGDPAELKITARIEGDKS